ncbi:unnamed protein product, partial [Rotaria sp. Silwood1]
MSSFVLDSIFLFLHTDSALVLKLTSTYWSEYG